MFNFGNRQGIVNTSSAEFQFNTQNGFGSTNTKIPKYTNNPVASDPSNLLLVANSSTLGVVITARRNCLVTMAFSFNASSSGVRNGITKNSTQLTTDFNSVTIGTVLCSTSTVGDDSPGCATATLFLAAGEFICPHTNQNTSGSTPARGTCYVTAYEVT